jgi:hypothetical protein
MPAAEFANFKRAMLLRLFLCLVIEQREEIDDVLMMGMKQFILELLYIHRKIEWKELKFLLYLLFP